MNKKEMLKTIEQLEDSLRQLEYKYYALEWCIENPMRIKTKIELRPYNTSAFAQNFDLNIFNTNNSLFRYVLVITYYDKQAGKLVTKDIISRDGNYSINIKQVNYKWTQGDLELVFECKDHYKKDITIYMYKCNLYDIHSRSYPLIYLQESLSMAWRQLPFLSASEGPVHF